MTLCYKNLPIEHVIKSIEKTAAYILNEIQVDPFIKTAVRRISSPEILQTLSGHTSEQSLAFDPLWHDIKSVLSSIEPLIAFEALAGGAQIQDFYYTIAMWDGFTASEDAKHIKPAFEKCVRAYIFENLSKASRVEMELKKYDDDPMLDGKIGLDIMSDDERYAAHYGHDRMDLKKKIQSAHHVGFNVVTDSRYCWLQTPQTMEELKTLYPHHVFVKHEIPFDRRYLKDEFLLSETFNLAREANAYVALKLDNVVSPTKPVLKRRRR